MNFAKMNMNNYKTHYFSSEMGAMEFRDRLSKFDDMNFADWAKVSFKERAGNFADVIDPDGINIIDFLELHDNFYIVGGLIKAIFDKLKFGIAVIALQKPGGRDEGVGGEKSKEKARLYLSMSPGLIKITKAKNWADSRVNPNKLLKKFSLVHGCKFIEQSTWEHEIDENTKSSNKITFNFETMKFEGITVEQVKFWENAYPDVDVVGIILRKSPEIGRASCRERV